MTLKKVEDIKELQIGLTSRCTGSCKFCFRMELINCYQWGGYPAVDIDAKHLFKVIDSLPNLKNILLIGNKGEVICHPEINYIIKELKSRSKIESIYMATNGSSKKKIFWRWLGTILGEHDNVVFAIDGLQDTHHIYRKSKFDTVFGNMIEFIKGGGNAWWQFIVFKHNQHQVEEARKLAKSVGCRQFIVMASRRYDDEFERPVDCDEISQKTKFELALERIDDRKVSCESKINGRVYMTTNGLMFPCCRLACFYSENAYRDPLQLSTKILVSQSRGIISTYRHSVEEILNSDFFRRTFDHLDDEFTDNPLTGVEYTCWRFCRFIDYQKQNIRREENLC
ncbi:MAG: hypothetical protein KGD64_02060 [Candidatus Heimdallarchaeota archaeon]|nr:hypothetical protein [Candidatus Heimdallarchaeota archaeon]